MRLEEETYLNALRHSAAGALGRCEAPNLRDEKERNRIVIEGATTVAPTAHDDKKPKTKQQSSCLVRRSNIYRLNNHRITGYSPSRNRLPVLNSM